MSVALVLQNDTVIDEGIAFGEAVYDLHMGISVDLYLDDMGSEKVAQIVERVKVFHIDEFACFIKDTHSLGSRNDRTVNDLDAVALLNAPGYVVKQCILFGKQCVDVEITVSFALFCRQTKCMESGEFRFTYIDTQYQSHLLCCCVPQCIEYHDAVSSMMDSYPFSSSCATSSGPAVLMMRPSLRTWI